MAVNSPFSRIFLAIMARIQSQVTEIKHIDQDFGQIEGASSRPAVAFPLILVDFDGWQFTDTQGGAQVAEGDVVVKLGFAQYTPSSEKVDAAYREEALKFYELEWKLHKALQDWCPAYQSADEDRVGQLDRRSVITANRAPGVRIRTMRYRLEFEDYSTKETTTTIPKPPYEHEAE